jgi:hypothetical protein
LSYEMGAVWALAARIAIAAVNGTGLHASVIARESTNPRMPGQGCSESWA